MIDRARQRQLVEEYSLMFGDDAGRLAAAMDLLADAEIAAGAHVPYCGKTRRDGGPSADLADAMDRIREAKELVTAVFGRLKGESGR